MTSLAFFCNGKARAIATIAVLALIILPLLLSAENQHLQRELGKEQGDSIIKESFAASISANNDNRWYIGKDLRENMYLKYKISQIEANSGNPYEMTIYFKEFDKNNKYWIAPFYVYLANGQLLNGTFHLDERLLQPLNSSEIHKDVGDYSSAYSTSIGWLSYMGFASKDFPQSLDAPDWGKAACLAGCELRLVNKTSVTVPAGTFSNTTLVTDDVGQNIWLNGNLPYPVKGQFVERLLDGTDRLHYEYELLDVGEGYPKTIPEFQSDSLSLVVTLGAILGVRSIILKRKYFLWV